MPSDTTAIHTVVVPQATESRGPWAPGGAPPFKVTRTIENATASALPALTPAQPELERFRNALVEAMARKRMNASDVAREIWGSKEDSRGRTVARNRDRMTYYLAGKAYPRPETVARLAQVLDLPLEALARDAASPSTTPGPVAPRALVQLEPPESPGAFEFRLHPDNTVSFAYNKRVSVAQALKLFDAIRKIDPDFYAEMGSPPGAVPDEAV